MDFAYVGVLVVQVFYSFFTFSYIYIYIYTFSYIHTHIDIDMLKLKNTKNSVNGIKYVLFSFLMAKHTTLKHIPYYFFFLFSVLRLNPQNRDHQQCYISLDFSSSETKIALYQLSGVYFNGHTCCCPFISAFCSLIFPLPLRSITICLCPVFHIILLIVFSLLLSRIAA